MLKKSIGFVLLMVFVSLQTVCANPAVLRKNPFGLSTNTADVWATVLANDYWRPFYRKPSVQHQIAVLRKRIPDLQHSINNAAPYIAYVYAHANALHIPAQFALLPLIESDYNPLATNRNGAGLWQLEKATARYMKIPVNNFYDGRRDLVVSTHAALLHLRDAYRRFNNWELATAAYNCGTVPVRKAIKRNKRHQRGTDFWSIRSQLPRITQAYVPRLAAMSYILSHASAYGLVLPGLSIHSAVGIVTVKQALSLKRISQLSHVSLKLLQQLNPALLQQKTSRHVAYHLVLPVSAAVHFKANLSSGR